MRISDWSSDVCSSDLIGELSFRIRVMNKEGEARPVPCRRPLRHGEVAIGVSSDEDRPPADVPRNAHRLTFLVVDESDGRVFQHLRDTVDTLEVSPAEAPEHILRRHPDSSLAAAAHATD